MKHLKQRNIKIISELTCYLVSIGCSDIHIDFSTKEDETRINFSSLNPNLNDNILNELAIQLNIPRRRDVEEYYWELNGDDDLGFELSLIGMMTDSADIKYIDNILKVNLLRLK